MENTLRKITKYEFSHLQSGDKLYFSDKIGEYPVFRCTSNAYYNHDIGEEDLKVEIYNGVVSIHNNLYVTEETYRNLKNRMDKER